MRKFALTAKKIILPCLLAVLLAAMTACAALPVADKVEAGTIEWIAMINGCSVNSLNLVRDGDGYVEFLGEKHTDRKITNAEEALESLEKVENIAGLQGLEFAFLREDVSPVTGYKYYSFSQVSRSGGVRVQYSNSGIKVIADSRGNAKGFSAQVNRSLDEENRNAEFISRTEAENHVRSLIAETADILSEYTTLEYWEDEVTSSLAGGTRIVPVWMVVTDEPSSGKPYTTFLVYAVRDYDLSVVDRIASESPSEVVNLDSPVSQLFFIGMEDAGDYSYSLDMTWAMEADSGYMAADPLEVTVPVMYNPSNGLYYLADTENRIAVTNDYDFARYGNINPVVTKTPEKLDSWHFENPGSGDITYFFNPNYVLASYWCMCNVCDAFAGRYGEDFLKNITPPVLLGVYLTEGDYPESEDGFTANASSAGQTHGWNVFLTSPAHSISVSFGALAHEFAHGINSQLSSTRYQGETGAVVEGFADAVGEQLAYVSGYKQEKYKWLVGSEYSEALRSWEEPVTFGYAKYIGGARYITAADESFDEINDNSGVHINGGAVNYLTYAMCNSAVSESECLEIDENLDLWLETVYCATYTTGFEELGAHLVYAAEALGLDGGKQQHVKDTVGALGFGGAGPNESLLAGEKSFQYSAEVEYGEDFPEEYGVILTLESEDDRLVSGEPDESGAVTIRAEKELPEEYRVCLYVGDKKEDRLVGSMELLGFTWDNNSIRLYCTGNRDAGQCIYVEYEGGCAELCIPPANK